MSTPFKRLSTDLGARDPVRYIESKVIPRLEAMPVFVLTDEVRDLIDGAISRLFEACKEYWQKGDEDAVVRLKADVQSIVQRIPYPQARRTLDLRVRGVAKVQDFMYGYVQPKTKPPDPLRFLNTRVIPCDDPQQQFKMLARFRIELRKGFSWHRRAGDWTGGGRKLRNQVKQVLLKLKSPEIRSRYNHMMWEVSEEFETGRKEKGS